MTIVVGVSGSGLDGPVLDLAIDQAARRGLPLQVVHAYQPPVYGGMPAPLAPETILDLRHTAEQIAQRALDRAGRVGEVALELVVVEADPTSALLAHAETASLLVVGCRGAGPLSRGLLGSVSAGCLHHAAVPVMVVPRSAVSSHDRFLRRRVLVALDGSPASLSALSWAAGQARAWDCSLVPVVVSPSSLRGPVGMAGLLRGPQDSLELLVERQVKGAGGAGLIVHPRVLVGDPSAKLLDLLEPDDLMVVGSRGHGALTSLLLGSTSLSVAEQAPCPVVVVRAGEARRAAALDVTDDQKASAQTR